MMTVSGVFVNLNTLHAIPLHTTLPKLTRTSDVVAIDGKFLNSRLIDLPSLEANTLPSSVAEAGVAFAVGESKHSKAKELFCAPIDTTPLYTPWEDRMGLVSCKVVSE